MEQMIGQQGRLLGDISRAGNVVDTLASDALQIGSLGLIAAVSHLLLIMAFRAAPATTLSPFSYAQLAWATLFGWIAFGDLPDGASSAGMGIIAASGLGVAYLERRKREESVRE